MSDDVLLCADIATGGKRGPLFSRAWALYDDEEHM